MTAPTKGMVAGQTIETGDNSQPFYGHVPPRTACPAKANDVGLGLWCQPHETSANTPVIHMNGGGVFICKNCGSLYATVN